MSRIKGVKIAGLWERIFGLTWIWWWRIENTSIPGGRRSRIYLQTNKQRIEYLRFTIGELAKCLRITFVTTPGWTDFDPVSPVVVEMAERSSEKCHAARDGHSVVLHNSSLQLHSVGCLPVVPAHWPIGWKNTNELSDDGKTALKGKFFPVCNNQPAV